MRSCISRTTRGPAEQGENGRLSCSCRLSGVGTPYPQAGPFPPFRGTQFLSFPEREGGPSEWTVDRFLHRPYDLSVTFSQYLVLVVSQACEPPTRKRVLSPFSTGLGDSFSSSPSQGDTMFHGTKRHNFFCPSLEGKGDRAHARWIGPACTLAFVVQTTELPTTQRATRWRLTNCTLYSII